MVVVIFKMFNDGKMFGFAPSFICRAWRQPTSKCEYEKQRAKWQGQNGTELWFFKSGKRLCVANLSCVVQKIEIN